jgi:hypothetical protein
MWKVLTFDSGSTAGSLIVAVFDSGTIGRDGDGGSLLTEANARIWVLGLNADRDAAAKNAREEVRRAAIV